MRRGEIWWVRFNSPIGHRPAVLLSRDSAYAVRASVTVAPITRSMRNIPSYVRAGRRDGLPQESAIDLDDIQTVPLSRLEQLITALSAEKVAEIDVAIKFALALR